MNSNKFVDKNRVSKWLPLVITIFIVAGVVFRPFMFLAIILFAYIIVFSRDSYHSLTAFLFTIPFAGAFKLSPDSGTFVTYMMLLFVLRELFRVKLSKRFFIAWLLYSIYVMIGGSLNFNYTIKLVLIPFMVYVVLQPNILKNTKILYFSYVNGVILSSFVGLFKKTIPNMSAFINSKATRVSYDVFADRFSGMCGDPNYYSVSLLLCFSIVLFMHVKGYIGKINAFICYGIIIAFGAMTGSKSFVLVVALVSALMVIELIKHKNYIVASIYIIVIIVFVCMIISGKIMIFNLALERMRTASNASEFTTERSTIWKMYTDGFISNPLKAFFGNGLNQGFSFNRYPHNTYIDFIDILGVAGSSLFLYSLICTNRNLFKCKNLLSYIPLLVLLLLYFSLSMLLYLEFVFQIAIALAIVCENIVIEDS